MTHPKDAVCKIFQRTGGLQFALHQFPGFKVHQNFKGKIQHLLCCGQNFMSNAIGCLESNGGFLGSFTMIELEIDLDESSIFLPHFHLRI